MYNSEESVRPKSLHDDIQVATGQFFLTRSLIFFVSSLSLTSEAGSRSGFTKLTACQPRSEHNDPENEEPFFTKHKDAVADEKMIYLKEEPKLL